MIMRLQPSQTWPVFPRRLFIAETVLAHIQYSTKFEFRTVPMRYFVFFLHKNVPQRLCPTFGVHFKIRTGDARETRLREITQTNQAEQQTADSAF